MSAGRDEFSANPETILGDEVASRTLGRVTPTNALVSRGQSTHIVTGDADLLALHPFQGVRIVTPGTFLEAE